MKRILWILPVFLCGAAQARPMTSVASSTISAGAVLTIPVDGLTRPVGDFAGPGASHQHSFYSPTTHGSSTGLRSDYNVTVNFAGFFMTFGSSATGSNFSSYRSVNLWVRGDSDNATPAQIKIELEDAGGTRQALIPDNTTTPVTPIAPGWHLYQIDFTEFSGLQPDSIRQISVVYEDFRAVNKIGTVFYDEIWFN